eukprot:PITA_25188
MEEIRRRLMEFGVIGPELLFDFNPRMGIVILYGDTRINIGDEVAHAQVQHPPDLDNYYNLDDLEIQQIFRHPKLVALVLMDPDDPDGGYLHRLQVGYLCVHSDIELPPMIDVVPYEPPRPFTSMLVFALFKMHEFQPFHPPNSREGFRITAFVLDNALGLPVGASFFTISHEKEEPNCSTSSGCCSFQRHE